MNFMHYSAFSRSDHMTSRPCLRAARETIQVYEIRFHIHNDQSALLNSSPNQTDQTHPCRASDNYATMDNPAQKDRQRYSSLLLIWIFFLLHFFCCLYFSSWNYSDRVATQLDNEWQQWSEIKLWLFLTTIVVFVAQQKSAKHFPLLSLTNHKTTVNAAHKKLPL